MKKAYFQYYETFEKIVQKFKSEADQNAFRQKIIEYGLFGTEPELNELENMVWDVVKDMIDSQLHRREVNAENRTGKRKEEAPAEAQEVQQEIKAPAAEEKKESKKRFIKPTVEEIAEYCTSRYNQVNAQAFYDYYESKGWKIGAAPMKDWKAAVRTWEQRTTQSAYYSPGKQLPAERLTL